MRFFVDLRSLIPPFLSLCFMILLSDQDKPAWPAEDHVIVAFDILYHHPFFLIFHTSLTLLFLFISVKLPFTLTLTLILEPIRLRLGDFSLPFTLSMLAAPILLPSHFWLVYPLFIILTSRWFGMVLDVFNSIRRRLYHTLQYIPILIIDCTFQRQEEVDAATPQVEIEVVEIEGSNE